MSSIRKLQSQLQQSPYAANNRYLGMPDFGMMMMVAAGIHLVVVVIFALMPKHDVDTIPVRVLNVRLGVDGGTLAPDAPTTGSATADGNQIRLGNASMGQAVGTADGERGVHETPEAPPEQKPPEHHAKAPPGKLTAASSSTPQQLLDQALSNTDTRNDRGQVPDMQAVTTEARAARYVRPQGAWGQKQTGAQAQVAQGNEAQARYGHTLGNSLDVQAESLTRYGQAVALWINKHKTYPEAAYERGIQGSGKMYIESDRSGRILRHYISESTGSTVLDWAMRDAVSQSNPLPAVPADHATGEVLRHVVALDFYRRR
jgi:TonB family protein